MGVAIAFCAAVAAELKGSGDTTAFTRPMFLLTLLMGAGVSVSGLASWSFDALAVVVGWL
ncbi:MULTISPECIES: hypothetical protein [unclassified Haloferax]|uniref:hypothetical protein n=1 Tax=unclassified Haloferax TaxID=2625095 RepID=UPI002876F2A4|nr:MULTISPECIES: hypothetical protein [unclassified Haloferax]MDS0243942.1 hypothetical protein [Haloferax sp. S2CR25]MDS0447063.1 hypothetical protein [Haloferax sp. S2CR25-2]